MSKPPMQLDYAPAPAEAPRSRWAGYVVVAYGVLLTGFCGVGAYVQVTDENADVGAPCVAVMLGIGIFLLWYGAVSVGWIKRGKSFRLR